MSQCSVESASSSSSLSSSSSYSANGGYNQPLYYQTHSSDCRINPQIHQHSKHNPYRYCESSRFVSDTERSKKLSIYRRYDEIATSNQSEVQHAQFSRDSNKTATKSENKTRAANDFTPLILPMDLNRSQIKTSQDGIKLKKSPPAPSCVLTDANLARRSPLREDDEESERQFSVETVSSAHQRNYHSLDVENITLRALVPEDKPHVKELCRDWFPIEYPDSWYNDITTNNARYHSVAATHEADGIVGLIVVNFRPLSQCDREDSGLLPSHFPPASTCVAYILMLGVTKDYRRRGLATLLIVRLIDQLSTTRTVSHEPLGCALVHKGICKAIYLHVLSTNQVAIQFYERINFRAYRKLPYYYSINGTPRDGFSYVFYMNGGYPPRSWMDALCPLSRATTSVMNISVKSRSELSSWMWRSRLTFSQHPRMFSITTLCHRMARVILKVRNFFAYMFQTCIDYTRSRRLASPVSTSTTTIIVKDGMTTGAVSGKTSRCFSSPSASKYTSHYDSQYEDQNRHNSISINLMQNVHEPTGLHDS